ncbi:MAG: hypothetical protein H7A25_11265 [Leptospiraceae bacterium]|nr:hypothetical protein [Leptospiraceae bacterium]
MFFIHIISILYCSKSPLQKGNAASQLEMTYVYTDNIGYNSSKIIWGCSSESEGILLYGKGDDCNEIHYLPVKSKHHELILSNLDSGQRYSFIAFCRNISLQTSYKQSFVTLKTENSPPPSMPGIPSIGSILSSAILPVPTIKIPVFSIDTISTLISESTLKRSIWILGGIGNGLVPMSQVDVFDPNSNTWYSNITSIPTARTHSAITSYNGKIYVLGGLVGGNTTGLSEEYDPVNGTWRTLASMPSAIQGALAFASDSGIYVLGGSVTASSASAIPNVVYKLDPDIGSSGTWFSLTSQNTIPSRIDLSGCSSNGSLFFNLGRDASGNPQFTSEAYNPASNSTSQVSEANFNQPRFGAASACYRPYKTDPYPSDLPAMFVAGGSTLGNTAQPPGSILASNSFEFYYTPPSTNVVNSGQSLPVARFASAMEISYLQRNLYFFGGANPVNVPNSEVYSLSLSDPSNTSWVLVGTMPAPRFGHKAVIIDR